MKSILVIDTPKTCAECSCHLWQVCVPADEDIDEYINPSKGKPDWCPLKSLPKRKKEFCYKGEAVHGDTYEHGFNNCLDAITGETE